MYLNLSSDERVNLGKSLLFLDQNRAFCVAQNRVAHGPEHAGDGVQTTTAHDDEIDAVIPREIENSFAGLALTDGDVEPGIVDKRLAELFDQTLLKGPALIIEIILLHASQLLGRNAAHS